MTIQHLILKGERYVLIPEHEFRELQRKLGDPIQRRPEPPAPFREVTPLPRRGEPASKWLIQDRR